MFIKIIKIRMDFYMQVTVNMKLLENNMRNEFFIRILNFL
jgi:hypothetical protein